MASLAWSKIKVLIWLGLGVICLFSLLFIWIFQGVKRDVVEKPIEVIEQEEIRPVKIEEVKFNANLGSFYSEVPALNLVKRNVEIGHHEPEFRGTKFIDENKKAWTLQLMVVTEEDIIRAYLAKRDDRSEFYYFRLQEDNKPTQYVLTYGIFKDVKPAVQLLEKMDFSLPESVKIIPERFVNYASKVNDLGSDELAQGSQLRNVILTRAALPKITDLMPREVSNRLPSELTGGTTTTVERKDEQGNVKSTSTNSTPIKPPKEETKKTLSGQSPSQNVEHIEQVVDPF